MAITACFMALIATRLKKRIHTNTSFWAVTLSFWSNMRISRQNNSILAAFGLILSTHLLLGMSFITILSHLDFYQDLSWR